MPGRERRLGCLRCGCCGLRRHAAAGTRLTSDDSGEEGRPLPAAAATVDDDAGSYSSYYEEEESGANEEGEVLPKFLMQKFIAIESGKVFGKPTSIVTSDAERDRALQETRTRTGPLWPSLHLAISTGQIVRAHV